MTEYRFFLFHKDIGQWTRIKDPKGWDGLGRTIKRFGIGNSVGQKWHGLFYEYTAKVGFIKDGKDFITAFYNTYGVEQELLLRIDRRNELTRKFETEYTGRLGLATLKIKATEVEVAVENTGFIQRVKNGLDVKVSMANPITSTFHSKVIRRESRVKADKTIADFFVAQPSAGILYLIFPWSENEVDELDTFFYPIQLQEKPPWEELKYHLLAKEDGDYKINLHLELGIQQVGEAITSFAVTWFLKTGKPGSYTTTQIGSNITGSVFAYETRELVDHEVTLAKGDEVYVYGHYSWVGGFGTSSPRIVTYNSHTGGVATVPAPADKFSQATVLADTTVPPSDVEVVMVHEAFEQVLQGLTGQAGSFYSEYFGRTENGYASDGAGSLRAITNGYRLRGLPNDFTCTLRDLVDTFAGIDGIGLGIERVNGTERVRVEPLTFWYPAKRAMRLSFIKDIEKEVEPDLLFNQIEVGPEKWQNEDINNLDEFNAKREWTTPITQVKNLLDLKIPYITSGFSIEYTRRASAENTTDSRWDEENFVIQMIRSGGGFVPARDEAFSAVTGVLSPETSYNLLLSPRRALEQNGRLIRAGLARMKDMKIAFAAGSANVGMSSTLIGGQALAESQDITISTLPQQLWEAEVYLIRAKLSAAQMGVLATTDMAAAENVFGFVEFSKTDQDYKRGFILEARPSSTSNEVEIKLLRATL